MGSLLVCQVSLVAPADLILFAILTAASRHLCRRNCDLVVMLSGTNKGRSERMQGNNEDVSNGNKLSSYELMQDRRELQGLVHRFTEIVT